jgi:hypothetical protein
MAGHVLFQAYGETNTGDAKLLSTTGQIFPYSGGAGLMGIGKSVAAGGTIFTAISPAITVGTAVCNALVQILPTGSNHQPKGYLTDSTVATLNTGAA